VTGNGRTEQGADHRVAPVTPSGSRKESGSGEAQSNPGVEPGAHLSAEYRYHGPDMSSAVPGDQSGLGYDRQNAASRRTQRAAGAVWSRQATRGRGDMVGESRLIYQGRIIRLALETVRLPNGAEAELEIVHHPGGAAVVALDAQRRICLLRQYRHAAGGWLWELPAGKLDAGEAPLVTAQRELEEEAGVQAGRWETLGRIVSSPGVFTEVIHLFLAQGLAPTPAHTEDHEVIEVHWFSWDEALHMAQRGDIEDAKTLAGLLRAQARLANQL